MLSKRRAWLFASRDQPRHHSRCGHDKHEENAVGGRRSEIVESQLGQDLDRDRTIRHGAIELYENLVKNVNEVFKEDKKQFNKEIIKPKFL